MHSNSCVLCRPIRCRQSLPTRLTASNTRTRIIVSSALGEAAYGAFRRLSTTRIGGRCPVFTVISEEDSQRLRRFFIEFGRRALHALTPGGHVFIASNPLLSSMTFYALQEAGFEKRGEIIRLVQTLRGGYKPKGSEADFPEVSVMPRACWEPWGIFRKPFDGTVADNLRRWGAGGLRRSGDVEPLKDVIACSPTRGREKQIAPHRSLKPQRFLRKLTHAALPLGIGIIYDRDTAR